MKKRTKEDVERALAHHEAQAALYRLRRARGLERFYRKAANADRAELLALSANAAS